MIFHRALLLFVLLFLPKNLIWAQSSCGRSPQAALSDETLSKHFALHASVQNDILAPSLYIHTPSPNPFYKANAFDCGQAPKLSKQAIEDMNAYQKSRFDVVEVPYEQILTHVKNPEFSYQVANQFTDRLRAQNQINSICYKFGSLNRDTSLGSYKICKKHDVSTNRNGKRRRSQWIELKHMCQIPESENTRHLSEAMRMLSKCFRRIDVDAVYPLWMEESGLQTNLQQLEGAQGFGLGQTNKVAYIDLISKATDTNNPDSWTKFLQFSGFNPADKECDLAQQAIRTWANKIRKTADRKLFAVHQPDTPPEIVKAAYMQKTNYSSSSTTQDQCLYWSDLTDGPLATTLSVLVSGAVYVNNIYNVHRRAVSGNEKDQKMWFDLQSGLKKSTSLAARDKQFVKTVLEWEAQYSSEKSFQLAKSLMATRPQNWTKNYIKSKLQNAGVYSAVENWTKPDAKKNMPNFLSGTRFYEFPEDLPQLSRAQVAYLQSIKEKMNAPTAGKAIEQVLSAEYPDPTDVRQAKEVLSIVDDIRRSCLPQFLH